ncbi:MAG: hypothetical protein DRI77_04015, partial [Chloroflexi bacterium]
MTLSVHSYHDASGFETLAGEWNDLLHRSPADTIFLTLEYQRTWWHHLGEGELLILAVHDDEELVGIAPLFAVVNPQGQRVLATVGCVEVSDYLDLIVARGRESDVYGALVDYLAGGEVEWDVLDLCNVHQDSSTLELLPALVEARGWAIEMARDDVCPVVQLPGTWDEYLQMLSKKQRHEVRRKIRRIQAQAEAHWY